MELKYIVYITINLKNGKFYIGVHRTNPLIYDGYIGAGIYRMSDANEKQAFHRAVRKYGIESFKRTTIKIFPDTDEGKKAAFDLEAVLVNETLLKSKQCYNVALGGGGPNYKKKRVFLYTLNGEFLRSFKSIRDAAYSIKTDNYESAIKAIRNNCLRKTKSAFNYFWSYTKEFIHSTNKKWKQVAQYTYSGKFLRHFDSIAEAQEILKINTISQAIDQGYLSGGYQWRYFNNDTSDIDPYISSKNKNRVMGILMFKDNTLVEKFESIDECVLKYPNLSKSQINRVLKGIIRSHRGYIFKYKDKDIVDTYQK